MRRNTLLPALLGWATVSGYDADPLSHFYPDICPIFSTALTATISGLTSPIWLLATVVNGHLVATPRPQEDERCGHSAVDWPSAIQHVRRRPPGPRSILWRHQ